MFNDSGLFYAEHTLSIGSFEFRFSMINETSIEDFTLGNSIEVNSFIDGLGSIKENIDSIKTQIEVINFNYMAVLDSKNPLINIESNMLSKEPTELTPNIEELKQAHDTSLLKDKVSHLLD
jgi:archaellum component FlaC